MADAKHMAKPGQRVNSGNEDTRTDPPLSIEGIGKLHTVHAVGEYVLRVFITVTCLALLCFACLTRFCGTLNFGNDLFTRLLVEFLEL